MLTGPGLWAWGQDMSVGFFLCFPGLSLHLCVCLCRLLVPNLLVSLAERLDSQPQTPDPVCLSPLCLCLGLWLGVWDYGWPAQWLGSNSGLPKHEGICESGLWLATLSYERARSR